MPVNARGRAPALKTGHGRVHPVRRHNINWMLIGVALTLVAVLAGAGYMLYICLLYTSRCV